MQATITIDMENDAFATEASFELARILRRIAQDVESSGVTESKVALRDVNGNTCGWFQVAR